MTLNNLTQAAASSQRSVSRILARRDDGRRRGSEWKRMLEGGFASVEVAPTSATFSELEHSATGREQLRERMGEHYPGLPQVVSKATNQLFHFASVAQERDIVAGDGERQRVRGGAGRLTGP